MMAVSYTHLDVYKRQRKLIRDIFDDYTTGANPVFDTDTVVHVGADEFIIPNGLSLIHI